MLSIYMLAIRDSAMDGSNVNRNVNRLPRMLTTLCTSDESSGGLGLAAKCGETGWAAEKIVDVIAPHKLLT